MFKLYLQILLDYQNKASQMKKTIEIRIPKQLEMLCEILETTPEKVLQEFANNLSLDHHYTSGSDERRMAVEYFMRCSYGMHLFDFEEVERMFDALNNIRYSFINFGNDREQEYIIHRDKEYEALFKEWKAFKTNKEQGI